MLMSRVNEPHIEFIKQERQEGKCCSCNKESPELEDGLCNNCMQQFIKAFAILFEESWKTFKGN